MHNQVITNALRENFNINNVLEFNSDSINLRLINRNMELKLESELDDIENEMKDIAMILRSRGEASGVYAILLGVLKRSMIDIHDLFDSMKGIDQIEANLILEKIKTKILRLDQKMYVLGTFVYDWDELSA